MTGFRKLQPHEVQFGDWLWLPTAKKLVRIDNGVLLDAAKMCGGWFLAWRTEAKDNLSTSFASPLRAT